MAEAMKCLKCSCEGAVRNGVIWGKQRYKCKQCYYQFTRSTRRGQSEQSKTLALILYLSGLSMNMTGKIVGVTAQSVMRWIKEFGEKALKELPIPSGIKAVEMDEMHHFLLKKQKKSGSGKCWIIELSDSVVGDVVIVVRKP
jgi:transposase-like protein